METETPKGLRDFALAARDEVALWQPIHPKGFLPCAECAWLQHESAGASGAVRQSRQRRFVTWVSTHTNADEAYTLQHKGAALNLCYEHAQGWRTRDAAHAEQGRAERARLEADRVRALAPPARTWRRL